MHNGEFIREVYLEPFGMHVALSTWMIFIPWILKPLDRLAPQKEAA